MKIVKNMETQRLELHCEKAEYTSWDAEQKKKLREAFLWSRYANAWVSRSTRNHAYALRIAGELGFDINEIESDGERLSFEEELNRKAQKAERRAERLEHYAAKAATRAGELQEDLNKMRGDIAFMTQPNINSSAGRSFRNYRERLFNRYKKGFDEYRKSEDFAKLAAKARQSAKMSQLNDPVYLHNRIRECKRNIAGYEKRIAFYEDQIAAGNENDKYETLLTDTIGFAEYEMDKQAFLQNCLDEIGGSRFSKENIKPGDIVKVRRWGKCSVLTTGPINLRVQPLGDSRGFSTLEPYAAVIEICS